MIAAARPLTRTVCRPAPTGARRSADAWTVHRNLHRQAAISTRIGPISTPSVVNLLLLPLYPIAWLAPLVEAGLVSWWSSEEISIIQGIRDLWAVDRALATLVALFAIVIPYGKTVCLAAIHFDRLGPRALPLIEAIGRLSMADVFLIALYIVIVKGVGFGHVETAWGLWLFTACVLASFWVAWATRRRSRTARGDAAPNRPARRRRDAGARPGARSASD